MRGVTGFRVLDALNGALAQLIPDRVPAAGEGGNTLAIFGADGPDGGDRFVFYELVVGTWGGTPTWDGNDGLTNPASLAANIPIEVAESEFPIVVERYGLVPDTGGAGRAPRRARGRARLALPDAGHVADRALRPGAPPALRARRRAARARPRATSSSTRTGRRRCCRRCSRPRSRRATSTCTGWPAAAAGATRSTATPAAVAHDVRDEKVSAEAARELYGVVIGAGRPRRRRGDGRPTRREETGVIGKADAVVIGAGIMGASTAHFLTRLGFGDVVLVDKRKVCGGSTQYSAAHVRQHYSNEVAIRLAVRGAAMFANAEEELGGPTGFQPASATCSSRRPRRRRRCATSSPVQQRFGVETALLAPEEVVHRWPRAPARGRRARVLRADVRLRRPRADGGVARRAPRSASTGSTSTRAARCSAISTANGRVTGVVTGGRRDRDGRRRQRLRAVGRPDRPHGRRRLPDRFSREHEAVFDAPEGFGDFPVISDVPQRFYCRPYAGGKVLVGEGWPKQIEPVDPETYDDGTDEAHLQKMVPKLLNRVPVAARRR